MFITQPHWLTLRIVPCGWSPFLLPPCLSSRLDTPQHPSNFTLSVNLLLSLPLPQAKTSNTHSSRICPVLPLSPGRRVLDGAVAPHIFLPILNPPVNLSASRGGTRCTLSLHPQGPAQSWSGKCLLDV